MSRCEKVVVSTTPAMVCHTTERPHSQATTMSVKVNQVSSRDIVDPILTNPAPYSVMHRPICVSRGTVVRKKSLEIHLSEVIPIPTTAVAYENTSENSIFTDDLWEMLVLGSQARYAIGGHSCKLPNG